jgi:hypothetical protein
MPAAKMHTLTLILAGDVIATIIQILQLRYMADLCSFALARLNARVFLLCRPDGVLNPQGHG